MEYYEGWEIAEVLDRARQRLETPGSWIRGDLAVDEFNFPVDPCHADACQWCLAGAIIVEATEADIPNWVVLDAVRDHLNKQQGFMGDCSPSTWNDHKAEGRLDVLDLLKEVAKEVQA